MYAATLLTYTEDSAAEGDAEKAPDAFRQADVAMEAILKFNLNGTAWAAEKFKKLAVTSDTVMMVVLAVIVIVGGWLIWAIPSSVVGPVQQTVALAETRTAPASAGQQGVGGSSQQA